MALVLIVDDESSARETMSAILEDDYQVSVAASGEAALTLLENKRFDVVCTDFQMPGLNGMELLRSIDRLYPSVVSILVTGYPDYVATTTRDDGQRFLLLVKPYAPQQLLRAVAQAVRFTAIRALQASLKQNGAR